MFEFRVLVLAPEIFRVQKTAWIIFAVALIESDQKREVGESAGIGQ